MKLIGYIRIIFSVLVLSAGGGCQAQAIKFTSFRATNEAIDSSYLLTKPIALTYKQTHIIVGFVDDQDSSKARYAYRLLGLDDRWHQNYSLTAVNYINLLGGNYILQVKNLNYPNRIASLRFYLEEAFWQRAWFVPMLTAYGLLVAGLILYFIRMYRFRNQLRLQHIRNEIAADLHDDVGTALSSISFLGEMAKVRFDKKPEDVQPILERIMNESREMIQTLRGVVWVINPQNDNIADFLDKVKSFAEAILASKKIDTEFVTYVLAEKQLGLEVQRNLFLIFKEAIVNIAKHSNGSKAIIAVKLENEHLWIRIEDNGSGFDSTQETEGNGLRNLKNRAVQLGGNLEVNSEPGSGTRIRMVIPIA